MTPTRSARTALRLARLLLIVAFVAAAAAGGTVSRWLSSPTASAASATSVVGGGVFSCALTPGGGVQCWGSNLHGQLGDGTTTTRLTPVAVVGLGAGVEQIAAGAVHTCALMTTGSVKCWGSNGAGQLGDGTTTNRLTPTDVVGLGGTAEVIAVGDGYTCAVLTGGGLKCWGSNGNGSIGDGTTTNRLTPTDVVGFGAPAVTVAAGKGQSCAVNTSGGLKCWGRNAFGMLGDGTSIQRNNPVQVVGLTSGIVSVAAGAAHTCALTTGGGVKCWGDYVQYQLGNRVLTDTRLPDDVIGLTSGVDVLVAGDKTNCVLMSGTMKCWGDGSYGQLGDSTNTSRPNAESPAGLTSGVVGIGAGQEHSCAVLVGGALKCWGSNIAGEVGDGTGIQRTTPVDVIGFEPTPTPTATFTATATNTPTPTNTPTNTSTFTPTATWTNTPTNTNTATATNTSTPTNTPTATNTPTPTATPTLGPGVGGPVVLMGIDAEDFGVGGHGPIANYVSIVSSVLADVSNGGANILVVGGGKTPTDDVTSFWNAIDAQIPANVTYVSGASGIGSQPFAGFAAVAVVSDQWNTPSGGLTQDENDALAARQADIAAFLNGGGGLIGFSSDFPNPYPYLSGVGSFSFNTGISYSDIAPTAAGTAIGITDALDVCCWHDEYVAYPPFLQVLARNVATNGVAALGGDQVAICDVSNPAADLDGDGLTTADEASLGTSACDADSDNDGLLDRPEDDTLAAGCIPVGGNDPTCSNTPNEGGESSPIAGTGRDDNCPLVYNPSQENHDANFIDLSPPKAYDDLTAVRSDAVGSACDLDDDNDGRSDADEIAGIGCGGVVTDSLRADTDGDRILDGAECTVTFTNPVVIDGNQPSCQVAGDADGDGILDARERCFYGSAGSTDADGDGCRDRIEIASINGDQAVNVIDLQQIAAEIVLWPAGNYPDPGPAVPTNLDITKDGSLNVIDLQQAAAAFGSCP